MIVGYEQLNSEGKLVRVEVGGYDENTDIDAKYEELKETYADDDSVIGVFKALDKRGNRYRIVEMESI